MIIGMTAYTAMTKYSCDVCKAGGDCGFECVLSETCSLNCTHCGNRVWFQGDLHNVPKFYRCPYCEKPTTTSYYKP